MIYIVYIVAYRTFCYRITDVEVLMYMRIGWRESRKSIPGSVSASSYAY